MLNDVESGRLRELIILKLNNTLSESDAKELSALMVDQEIREFVEKFNEPYLFEQIALRNRTNTAEEWQKLTHLLGKNNWGSIWKKMAIAASFIGIISIGVYYFVVNTREGKQPNNNPSDSQTLKAPVGNKAQLTLASGERIYLDSAPPGLLTTQGSSELKKEGDQLLYYKVGDEGEVAYNTVTTAKGGSFKLVLADGSKVWLNASSSIRFPTAFQGSERIVEIEGEVFIDVAKNKTRPFKVISKGVEIQVLGTKFNVNAYKDNPSINTTTLVEGSIRVSSIGDSKLLMPGEQIAVLSDGSMKPVHVSNMSAITSWVENKFYFDNIPLKDAMEILARWYDFSVEVKGNLANRRVTAMMSRSNAANEILSVFEEACEVKIEVQNKIVIISPKVKNNL